jgi:hypothetical protein
MADGWVQVIKHILFQKLEQIWGISPRAVHGTVRDSSAQHDPPDRLGRLIRLLRDHADIDALGREDVFRPSNLLTTLIFTPCQSRVLQRVCLRLRGVIHGCRSHLPCRNR